MLAAAASSSALPCFDSKQAGAGWQPAQAEAPEQLGSTGAAMPPEFSRDSLSPCPCAVQVCDVKQLQDMVTTKLNALPNYKFKREGGGYRSYPHQFNATYFSACQESPRVRLHIL